MNAYDRVLYVNRPYAQTHPSRIFVQARLVGLEPPPVETCRVLDIGASEGANIIGMAVVLPRAEFTGIDLAAEPVARGRRAIDALGLRNVRIEQMDLLDLDESFGKFDFIVAHGLYAWTPAAVRDKILAVAKANLDPNGVAFVSYNTQPGGRLRQMLREMMLYRAGRFEEPADRLAQAREMLKLVSAGRPEMDALDGAIAAQAEELLARPDSSLFHDELGDLYEPVYFHEFAAHAARHGLAYIGDASVLDCAPRNLSAEAIAVVDRMAEGDSIARQQYFDFLRARRFRQSLLCHVEASRFDPLAEWDPARIVGCHAVCPNRESPEGTFVSPAGTSLTTSHPAPVAYLRRLIAHWPRSEPVAADDAALALELYRVGMIELHGFAGVAAPAGSSPIASPLARHQAATEEPSVTTLWHRSLEVEGESSRRMLRLLDGTRDRAELAEEMDCPREVLDAELDALGRHALLVG